MKLIADRLALPAAANLTTAYNLAVSGYVLFFITAEGIPVSEVDTSLVASAALIGAILGQLSLGYLGSLYGPHYGLVITLLLVTVGGVLSALVPYGSATFELLALFRFVVGVGCGGVYPLAAVVAAEGSSNESRGRDVILSFSFQGVGQFLAPLIGVALGVILPAHPGASWRIALLLGTVPAAWTIPWALDGIPTSQERPYPHSITADHVGTQTATNSDIDDQLSESSHNEIDNVSSTSLLYDTAMALTQWKYQKKLIGTAGGWFLFDVIFYGNIIFSPFVLDAAFDLDPTSSSLQAAGYSALIAMLGLPGFLCSAYFADSWGRKRIQVLGFTAVGILFVVMGMALDSLIESYSGLLFLMYAGTFFFYNFGPNSTTFCLPAETFPAQNRSVFHGVSAACGKAGAVVSALFFKDILDESGLQTVMYVCGGVALASVILTLAFVEDRRGMAMEGDVRVSQDGIPEGVEDHTFSRIGSESPQATPQQPSLHIGELEMALV